MRNPSPGSQHHLGSDPSVRGRSRRLLFDDSGFTLVELLTAATVLVVGMLGVVAMMAGANMRSVSNRGREGATNAQRELVERTRSIPYAQLTQASIYSQLQALPGLEDASSASGYQVRRRGFTYDVTLNVCSVDDAKDGYGPHDAQSFCAGSQNSPTTPPDLNPDDYKVVSFDLQWSGNQGHGRSRQQALINSPGSNVGPSVCSISINGSNDTTLVGSLLSTATSLNVGVCVTFEPSTVSVSIDGEVRGNALLVGGSWIYPWSISTLVDGNYLVSARAFDAQGRPGAMRSKTVTLNRFVAQAPTGLVAGRNGAVVEAEWLANKERDIVGYRLFRDGVAVATCSFTEKTECQDRDPPGSLLLTYTLKALDRNEQGQVREGLASLPVTVTQLNTRPNPPTGLTASVNAAGDTVLSWSHASPQDPNLGDQIAFYRIYRDGTAVTDRFDRTGRGVDRSWTDVRSAGESHTYWITAVDSQLAESTPVGPVTR